MNIKEITNGLDKEKYVIHSTGQGYALNSPIWIRKDGGSSPDLMDAMQYTKEEALEHFKHNTRDRIWKIKDILGRVMITVDSQYFNQENDLDKEINDILETKKNEDLIREERYKEEGIKSELKDLMERIHGTELILYPISSERIYITNENSETIYIEYSEGFEYLNELPIQEIEALLLDKNFYKCPNCNTWSYKEEEVKLLDKHNNIEKISCEFCYGDFSEEDYPLIEEKN